MDLLPVVTDSPWQIVQAQSKKINKGPGKNIDIKNEVSVKRKNVNAHIFVVANGTVPVPTGHIAGVKRKADSEESISHCPKQKKAKLSFIPFVKYLS